MAVRPSRWWILSGLGVAVIATVIVAVVARGGDDGGSPGSTTTSTAADPGAVAGDAAAAPCESFGAEEVAAVLGAEVELVDVAPTVCAYQAVDGSAARFEALGALDAAGFEGLATGGLPVAAPPEGADAATLLPGSFPGATRIAARQGDLVIAVDLARPGQEPSQEDLVALAEVVLDALPTVDGPADDEQVAGLCEHITTEELVQALGADATARPTTPPGSCAIADAAGTTNVVATVAQAEGATAQQVTGARTTTDAGTGPVEWPRLERTVGDAATYLVDPASDGRRGNLLVLDGDRLLNLSVTRTQGTADEAADAAVAVALSLLG